MSQQRVIRRLMVKAHHSGKYLHEAWHQMVYKRLVRLFRKTKPTGKLRMRIKMGIIKAAGR